MLLCNLHSDTASGSISIDIKTVPMAPGVHKLEVTVQGSPDPASPIITAHSISFEIVKGKPRPGGLARGVRVWS
jgi:hypothetical protein